MSLVERRTLCVVIGWFFLQSNWRTNASSHWPWLSESMKDKYRYLYILESFEKNELHNYKLISFELFFLRNSWIYTHTHKTIRPSAPQSLIIQISDSFSQRIVTFCLWILSETKYFQWSSYFQMWRLATPTKVYSVLVSCIIPRYSFKSCLDFLWWEFHCYGLVRIYILSK